MSTVRLSEEDDILLEKLRTRYILMGKKMTKKEILGKLIKETALKFEEQTFQDPNDLEEDPAWKLLKNRSNGE
ncbi:MAG: hypothetical protein ACXAEU_22535 [Candidatus Hodarchaeales archaeon]|jgi:hypothetical protein